MREDLAESVSVIHHSVSAALYLGKQIIMRSGNV